MKPESVRFSDLLAGRLFKGISELGSRFCVRGWGAGNGREATVKWLLFYILVLFLIIRKNNFKYVWGGGDMCLDMYIETRGQFEGALLPHCEF